jgi:hypothetical protein
VFVDAEIKALIHENFTENDVLIFKECIVVRHVQSSKAFTLQVSVRTVHEDSVPFHNNSRPSRTMMTAASVLYKKGSAINCA